MNFKSLADGLVKHAVKILAIPLLSNVSTFGAKLLVAASDGIITDQEYHSLSQGASTVNIVILLAVMLALAVKKHYDEQK